MARLRAITCSYSCASSIAQAYFVELILRTHLSHSHNCHESTFYFEACQHIVVLYDTRALRMSSLQQAGDPSANHDGLIISVVTVFCLLSFTALLLRLASKRIKRVALDWDDYLVIVAWVS